MRYGCHESYTNYPLITLHLAPRGTVTFYEGKLDVHSPLPKKYTVLPKDQPHIPLEWFTEWGNTLKPIIKKVFELE